MALTQLSPTATPGMRYTFSPKASEAGSGAVFVAAGTRAHMTIDSDTRNCLNIVAGTRGHLTVTGGTR
jgi:hypothetical protein